MAGPRLSNTAAADEQVQPPLRIAMIAPPWFQVPPQAYGGIEIVVAHLVDALTASGHSVTLIGAGEPGTAAERFIPVYDVPPSESLGSAMPEVVHAAAAGRLIEDLEVDVVHDHSLAGPLLARGRAVPTVVTAHGPVDDEGGTYLEWLGDSVSVVAISDAQRRINPRLNWVGRVYNAIDVETFPFREEKDDYLVWLGRFTPDKGPDLAIEQARAAGMNLVLAGKLNEPEEQEFFDEVVKPLLGHGVDYVGEADATEKRDLLAGARALCFPLRWDEPFGMVMIEAMACGTPVVGLRHGSVPEVVVSGVTGFVADDLDDFATALQSLDRICAADCREHVKQNFDLHVMAAGYEAVYRALADPASGTSRAREDRLRPA